MTTSTPQSGDRKTGPIFGVGAIAMAAPVFGSRILFGGSTTTTTSVFGGSGHTDVRLRVRGLSPGSAFLGGGTSYLGSRAPGLGSRHHQHDDV